MIKLVVLDLDGTLLNDDSFISKENQKTINYYENKGIKFVLASGRNVENIMHYASILNFKKYEGSIIGNNGQAIYLYKGNRLLASEYIMAKEAKKIYNEVKNDNYRLYFFTDKKHYFNELASVDEKQEKSLITERIFFTENRFNNIIIKSSNKQKINNLYNRLLKSKGEYGIFLVDNQTIQFAPKNVNKVNGLKLICQHNNYKKEEVLVFGNGLNDLKMLKEYPNTYCPNNAFLEVQEVCQVLKGNNNTDVISNKLKEILK